MSLCTLERTLARISEAPPESPVVVFKGVPGKFDVMFANTFHTQQRIRRSDPDLIGIYDRTMPPERVRNQLRAILRDNERPMWGWDGEKLAPTKNPMLE